MPHPHTGYHIYLGHSFLGLFLHDVIFNLGWQCMNTDGIVFHQGCGNTMYTNVLQFCISFLISY